MKMKQITFMILLSTISSTTLAKVSDFNNLINENIKAQNQLHREVKDNMKIAKERMNEDGKGNKITIVESDSSQYTVPSKKMRYKKEVHQYRPSTQKQLDRLANELNDADKGF